MVLAALSFGAAGMCWGSFCSVDVPSGARVSRYAGVQHGCGPLLPASGAPFCSTEASSGDPPFACSLEGRLSHGPLLDQCVLVCACRAKKCKSTHALSAGTLSPLQDQGCGGQRTPAGGREGRGLLSAVARCSLCGPGQSYGAYPMPVRVAGCQEPPGPEDGGLFGCVEPELSGRDPYGAKGGGWNCFLRVPYVWLRFVRA